MILIDKIFYNNTAKGISLWNISTSISGHHLTHFTIVPNERSDKPIPQKLLKRSFTKAIFTELNNALLKNNWG